MSNTINEVRYRSTAGNMSETRWLDHQTLIDNAWKPFAFPVSLLPTQNTKAKNAPVTQCCGVRKEVKNMPGDVSLCIVRIFELDADCTRQFWTRRCCCCAALSVMVVRSTVASTLHATASFRRPSWYHPPTLTA
ncbi:hypothetical protein DOTSEDRAFT_74620 [Dothistroma septosporum NZE10]|uniref:Uncharacterized protein n=1 Tax=Dothistroma septosporum (strain NZE10 / CBS 128990) TaxID=675120 RepID=N1PES7_DOTSN|nr:hypothetical protein DOTSEDRAFT_74620 [Dothistroma septosporum NZE10]